MGKRLICYTKCTTCQRAKRWLEEKGITFAERDVKQERPTLAELREWQEKSGLPLKKFFNTSGLLYKSLGLKDKLPMMHEAEQLELLASDGMLVKRPILLDGERVLVGFKETEWEQRL